MSQLASLKSQIKSQISNLKSQISNLKSQISPLYQFSSVFICVHLWIQFPSIRGLRAARALRAGDFAVGFRAAVAVELPGVAHFLDLVEIQIGDQQFILVAAGLGGACF